MPQSAAQIKKEILEPGYIKLHGGNVVYSLKNIHRRAGKVRYKGYIFPESELDDIISNAIDSRPKHASATVKGIYHNYHGFTGDPYFTPSEPKDEPVSLELKLEMVEGQPDFTVKETND